MTTIMVVGDSIHATLVRELAAARGVQQWAPAQGAWLPEVVPDVLWLAEEREECKPYEPPPEFFWYPQAEVILQTPVPIGTTQRLAEHFGRAITYLLENVRKGDSLADFPRAPLVKGIAGEILSPKTDEVLQKVFAPLVPDWAVPWRIQTATQAELTKHAINGLLATCAAFSEEIRMIGESHGMSVQDVEKVLHVVRADPRFGGALPILPKGRYSSHLSRDVVGLAQQMPSDALPLLEAVHKYRERGET